MKFFARKRLISLILAGLLLISTCAACAEQALVMKSAAVYASAKTSSSVLGKLKAGTQLEVVATKNGWAKVEMNGRVGYMKTNALGTYKTYDNMTAYTSKASAMYASFSTSSKKMGTIPAGAKVTVLATAGSWARVTYSKYTGFIAKANLTTKAPSSSPSSTITAYASVNNAKVYNASGKVIGTVPLNTSVTVLAVKNGICQVKRSGVVAYMMKSDLSASKVEEEKKDDGVTEISPTTFYVKNDGAKVVDSSGKVIGTLSLNTAVTVNAYTDTLARVSNGSTVGFMLKSDLSASKVEEEKKDDGVTEISPTTFYVKNDGAKVVDSSGKVIGTLSLNTAVTVNAYTDTLARVSNGSTVGFMLKSDLSASKVETSTNYTLQYGDKGEAVSKVQTRLKELGFFTGNVGGNYLDLTRAAVSAFQAAAGLDTTGICDEKTLTAMFSDSAPKKEAPKEEDTSRSSGTSSAKPATGTAKAMDWWTSGIQSIFARGTVATVTDVAAGIAWNEKRSGGTNHADVQPLTAADTAAMKKACGSWSWTRRAIFVTINGVNYAASMNCMPHGSGSITNNNFNGHHCIHFTNSRTHGSNKVCSLHQAAIKKAASATL